METKGFLSFYSATREGVESSKRALFLFDTVIVPTTEKALHKQIGIFSRKYPYVKNYLLNHLITLDSLGKDYADYIQELMLYFGKYHYENWLNYDFEKEVGDFMTQDEAMISWVWSLRAESIMLSQLVKQRHKIPSYWHDTEISALSDSDKFSKKIISQISFDKIIDKFIPDPTCFAWTKLVDIIESPGFVNLRAKLWSLIQTRTPLSEEYLKTLEEFFEKNYPNDLEAKIWLNIIEMSGGLLLPPVGIAKALHATVKHIINHKKYSWLDIVCQMRKMGEQNNNSTETV